MLDVYYFLKIALLSLVQGVTEILPISSSAHVLIIDGLICLGKPHINSSLQIGSIFSIMYFYRNIIAEQLLLIFTKKMLTPLSLKILIVLFPASVFGLADKKIFHLSNNSISTIATAMIVGGLVFIITNRFYSNRQMISSIEKISYKSSLIIGIAQIVAVFPGISRLGVTLVAARLLGINAPTSVTFSFLAAIPALALGSAYELVTQSLDVQSILEISTGIVITFLFSMLCIRKLIDFVSKPKSLTVFGYYRIILGTILYIALSI